MAYLYEVHLHTREGSACGSSCGKDYIPYFKELGYTGIIVTDHFWHGNCRPDRSLPWKEWVAEYIQGYLEAKEEGERLGLDVFFGWEITYENNDYLVYGPDTDYMMNHPEMLEWDIPELIEKIHAEGGAVIQAHPFRQRDYIKMIHLHPYEVDGWEVANAGNGTWMNILANRFAKNHGLNMTAGSDIHRVGAEPLYSMELDHRLESAKDYAQTIISGKGFRIRVPEDCFEGEIVEPDLPMRLYDGKGGYICPEKAPE